MFDIYKDEELLLTDYYYFIACHYISKHQHLIKIKSPKTGRILHFERYDDGANYYRFDTLISRENNRPIKIQARFYSRQPDYKDIIEFFKVSGDKFSKIK